MGLWSPPRARTTRPVPCLSAAQAAVVAGLMVSACACDDALVDSNFEGVELYSTSKLLVRPVGGYDRGELKTPRYALFWNRDGIFGNPNEGTEQPRTSRPLPTTVEPFSLFEVPGLNLLVEDGSYGLGRMRAYDDLNDNRVRDADEPFVGEAWEALLYVPKALSAVASPFGRPVPKGVHRVELPVACGPAPAGTDSCDANLGVQCRDHEPCGTAGVCMLTEGGRLWTHGVCGLPYDPVAPCVPEDSALFLTRDGSEAFLLKSCREGSDCGHSEFCDHGIAGCLSGGAHAIILGGAPLPALCQEPEFPTGLVLDGDAGM